jgi:phosphoribosylglycinamide formyltransferase-1
MLPIAILVSGSGTNLQALLDEMAFDSEFAAKPVLVLSDRLGIQALERAERAGVPTEVVDWSDFSDRATFTDAVVSAVKAAGAEALVLAGFMRILGPAAVEAFPNRIVNTHPALLPAFRGAYAVEQALAAGVKVTGVTVHFVDEEVDHGPIIAQQTVPVYSHDTLEVLQERIQVVEHMLFPDVVKAMANGELTVEGNHVTWQ